MGDRENPVSLEGSRYKPLLEVSTALEKQTEIHAVLRSTSVAFQGCPIRFDAYVLDSISTQVSNDYRASTSAALRNHGSSGFLPATTSSSGVVMIAPFSTPTRTPLSPAIMRSAASAPSLVPTNGPCMLAPRRAAHIPGPWNETRTRSRVRAPRNTGTELQRYIAHPQPRQQWRAAFHARMRPGCVRPVAPEGGLLRE